MRLRFLRLFFLALSLLVISGNLYAKEIEVAKGVAKLDDIVVAMKADFPSTWKFNKVGDDAYEVFDGVGNKWGTVYSDKIVAPARTAGGTPGNPILNKVPLAKSIKYDVDGFIYETDDLGRVLETTADLDDIARVRLGNQQIKAVDIKDGVRGVDQGGHIVGSRFTSLAGEGAFVKQEFQTQLDVDVFEIGGAGFVMVGTKVPNTITLTDKQYHMANDGLIWVNSQRTAYREFPQFGNTNITSGTYNGGRSDVYTGTMANIWLNNGYKESQSKILDYLITDITGDFRYYAVFDGTDINGDSDTTDIINPFELLSPKKAAFKSNTKADNDPIDGLIATISQQQKHRNTSLHESGHAVRIVPDNIHPISGQSVMRSGIGPGQIPTFTPAQIKQMNLKP